MILEKARSQLWKKIKDNWVNQFTLDSDTPSLPSSATDPSNTVQFQLLQRYVTED